MSPASVSADDLFAGGGDLGARMRATDWSATPLGPVEGWPQALRTCVRIVLTSRQPMFVWWGEQLVNLYNDAYRSILGGKHPAALGRPATEVWREIWDQIEPRATQAMRANEGTYDEALLLIMERNGYPEETFYTFSYSPVPGDRGEIGGILCANTDDTERIVNERRLALLRAVATRTTDARTGLDACRRAAEALADHPRDLPFALLYIVDADRRTARLAGAAGVPAGHALVRDETVALDDAAEARWPWREALTRGSAITVPLAGVPDVPRGPWDRPPTHAVMLAIPLSGSDRTAVLIAGLNPLRLFDDNFRRFVELAGGQLGAAVANAEAYDQERRRAETLAELDRAKTAFFSNVSHEFRTPLTLMLGPTEDALASPERALTGDALVAVHRNELRLLKLVNTLLQFSRIEAGRARASYQPTDLAAVTAEIASGFRSAIERAGLAFEVDCPPLPALVYVDRDLWEHVVLNLLSNALKFTFEGGVRVAMREHDGTAELEVSDTGIGIAAHELPRVFERFHRVENARARTHEGSGIGLALVQDLVRLHGGEVSATSEPGRGTTFRIRIPFGAAHLPAPAAGEPAARDRSLRAAYVEEASRWQAEPAPAPAAPAVVDLTAGGRARILLADDNADMRDYLRRLLADHWELTVVADGAQALAAARDGAFDLVLTDVMMPNLDGFGLIAALRGDPRTRTLPVIMLSARAGEEARLESLQAGADDYLVKPFSARELIARVRTHVELNTVRRRAELAEQHLRAALDAAAIGTYFWDLGADVVVHDDGVRRLFGMPPGDGLELAHYTARIHLEDRAHWLDALARCRSDGAGFDEEYRVVLPDGTLRWLRDKGSIVRGPSGEAAYLSGAVVDITDHKVLVQRVELARRDAEQANRAKDEFLAMLGHELRNPLSPIVTALQLLRHRGVRSKEQDIIARQVEHLVRLVDDLLDIARITRGKVELRREVLALDSVVAKAIEIATPLIEQRGHHLAVDVPPGLLVHGDAIRLSQIVANLLTNAAKYTPKGGRIAVTAARIAGERLELTVRDNGTGIARELLPNVFDLFVQGKRASDRRDGGLGIGLALVKNLVRLHGGEVAATSDGPGTGSAFTVRLPAAEVPARASGTHRATAAGGPRRRVLLVDDNVDAAEMLALMLDAEGHEVAVAHDGAQALVVAGEFRPEIAILDIGLPVMDGYELATRLQRDHEACRLIALSGYGQPGDQRRSRAAGFEIHLIKPVDYPTLVAALGRGAT